MLVLSRSIGERVIITTAAGERIAVVLLETKRGSARIGVDAGPTVRVNREEIELKRNHGEKP